MNEYQNKNLKEEYAASAYPSPPKAPKLRPIDAAIDINDFELDFSHWIRLQGDLAAPSSRMRSSDCYL